MTYFSFSSELSSFKISFSSYLCNFQKFSAYRLVLCIRCLATASLCSVIRSPAGRIWPWGETWWHVMRTQWSSSGPNLTYPWSLLLWDTDVKGPCCGLGSGRLFLCGMRREMGLWEEWLSCLWAKSPRDPGGTQRLPPPPPHARLWSWFLSVLSWSLCDLASIFHVFE